MIVEGQVHGGLADGIGMALMEVIAFDPDGNCLGGSLMDYLLPTSLECPASELGATVTPSPHHPIGAKGVGRVRHGRLAARGGQRGHRRPPPVRGPARGHAATHPAAASGAGAIQGRPLRTDLAIRLSAVPTPSGATPDPRVPRPPNPIPLHGRPSRAEAAAASVPATPVMAHAIVDGCSVVERCRTPMPAPRMTSPEPAAADVGRADRAPSTNTRTTWPGIQPWPPRCSWPSGWGSRSCSRASRASARPRPPRRWPEALGTHARCRLQCYEGTAVRRGALRVELPRSSCSPSGSPRPRARSPQRGRPVPPRVPARPAAAGRARAPRSPCPPCC